MDPVTHCTKLPSHSSSFKRACFNLTGNPAYSIDRSLRAMLIPNQETPPQSPEADQNALLSLEPRDHPQISLGHTSNMLIVSHNVKSKIKSFKIPTHYPCGIARTSEWYISIHNEDGNPSRANIKQALDRGYVRSFMDQTSDNWKETMGRFTFESNLFQEIGLTNAFVKTSKCAHQLIFEHINCELFFKQKYFW